MGELDDKLTKLKDKQTSVAQLKELVQSTLEAVRESIEGQQQANELRRQDILKNEDINYQLKEKLDNTRAEINKDLQNKVALIYEVIEEQGKSLTEVADTFKTAYKELAEELRAGIEKIELEVQVKHPTVKVPPAEIKVVEKESINDKYMGADFDTTKANLEYHGYLAKDGSWYIEKISHDSTGRNHRFKTGKKDYKQAWQTRDKGSYKHLNEVKI